jgi:hypothetical protein
LYELPETGHGVALDEPVGGDALEADRGPFPRVGLPSKLLQSPLTANSNAAVTDCELQETTGPKLVTKGSVPRVLHLFFACLIHLCLLQNAGQMAKMF